MKGVRLGAFFLTKGMYLDSIESALTDIKEGKIVIVVDDESRENEGDFVMAADKVTHESVNFMCKFGRGLICTPISHNRAIELDLDLMTRSLNNPNQAAFTVSVDSIYGGTGISAKDRARTIQALVNRNTLPEELSKPGHVFPLIADKNGLDSRRGHTEASVELARLSGHSPAAVLCEILDDDGETANFEYLQKLSKIFRLKIISVDALCKYIATNNVSPSVTLTF